MMREESTFLTSAEVKELTEYSRTAEQCKELDRIGVRYIRTRLGKPKILRKALDEMFMLKAANSEPELYLDGLNDG